jgi:hypothetical protein
MNELDASLRALWRWKWVLLLASAVIAAIAAGTTLLPPPSYTTQGLVEVGKVMGEPIDDVYAVAETIRSPGFKAALRERAGGALPGSVTAEAMTGGQGRLEHPILVRVVGSAPTADGAVAAARMAVDELMARHHERFERATGIHREYERVLATTGEPAEGQPADPEARRDLFDLRARIASPVLTFETYLRDPFPVPTAAQPRNTIWVAAVAFAVSLAMLMLIVIAITQVPRVSEGE